MQQYKQWIVTVVFALVLLQPFATASAASVYQVSVDTSSLLGSTGFMDLQFIRGDVTAPQATAVLSGFSGDQTLNSGVVIDGMVGGVLPVVPVHFGNLPAFNALLQPVTFGSTFGFNISFSGAYETALSGSGTRFSLALLDPAYNPLATVDPAGTILQFELMPGGSISATTFNANFTPEGLGLPSVVTLTAVPLPAALPLFLSAFATLGWYRRRAV